MSSTMIMRAAISLRSPFLLTLFKLVFHSAATGIFAIVLSTHDGNVLILSR